MTVADLIAALQKMPQDAECLIWTERPNGAQAIQNPPRCGRAVPDKRWPKLGVYRIISTDAEARRNLRVVRQVVVLE